LEQGVAVAIADHRQEKRLESLDALRPVVLVAA